MRAPIRSTRPLIRLVQATRPPGVVALLLGALCLGGLGRTASAQTVSPGFTLRVHAIGTTSLYGPEALAWDPALNGFHVRGQQVPNGLPVELSTVDLAGTVTAPVSLSTFRNSNGSGILVDPLTGDLILLDEDNDRIVLVDLAGPVITTLFDVPWNLNPFGNGTGQMEFACDPADPDKLYFWDTTTAKLYLLERGTGTLTEKLAFDQGTPVGQHATTQNNDIAIVPGAGRLILSEGSTGTVYEVDPSTTPATTQVLFSGFSGSITSVAYDHGLDVVLMVIDRTEILVGAFSGGTAAPMACGFNFLWDLDFGPPSSGLPGVAVYGVERITDTVYEIEFDLLTGWSSVPAVTYCTAQTNSLGCTSQLSFTGTPSATAPSSFNITATGLLNNKSGALFYSLNGSNSAPFQGGTLCVQPPFKRTPLQTSGGSPGRPTCTGSLSFDFNAWTASGKVPALGPCTKVYAQFWSRDPALSPGGTLNLTNAVEFTIQP